MFIRYSIKWSVLKKAYQGDIFNNPKSEKSVWRFGVFQPYVICSFKFNNNNIGPT